MTGDGIGVETRHGNADEVHQIVAGKSEREGERAREDRDAQDVRLQPLEDEKNEAACRPAEKNREQQVAVDEFGERVALQKILQALEYGEIDDRRERGAAPQGAETPEERHVAEREDDPREVHHDGAAGEGDDHREQNGRDDAHRARCIDELAQIACADRGIVRYFVDRNGDGRPEQTENERNGGRGRETPRVVEVQQDDVGEHDTEVEHHDFVEREEPGVEHAAAGHLHHAARRNHADDDTRRSDQQNRAHGCGLGTDCGVEEVDGVVGNAHEKT